MNDVLERLERSVEALRASPRAHVVHSDARFDLSPEPGPDGPEILFEERFGFPPPKSLHAGLYLPDEIAVDWRHDDRVAGEFAPASPYVAMYRRLDPSVQNWTLDGIRLSEMRILDAVVLQSSPKYTLMRVQDGRVAELLYLFDTRELFELELTYEEYLRRLSVTKGIIYWQYLYARGLKLRGLERATLEREIDFLRSAFPDGSYDELSARLQERRV